MKTINENRSSNFVFQCHTKTEDEKRNGNCNSVARFRFQCTRKTKNKIKIWIPISDVVRKGKTKLEIWIPFSHVLGKWLALRYTPCFHPKYWSPNKQLERKYLQLFEQSVHFDLSRSLIFANSFNILWLVKVVFALIKVYRRLTLLAPTCKCLAEICKMYYKSVFNWNFETNPSLPPVEMLTLNPSSLQATEESDWLHPSWQTGPQTPWW